MDNKIESFFTNAALQMNELFQASGTQAATTAAPANANDTTSLLAANDSVDHSVAEDRSGVLLDIYRPFDTSHPQLNDQLLLARTAEPKAVASSKSGPPTLTVSSQYNGGDHACYVVNFDRPVSRAEAEKAFFKDGKMPPAPPQSALDLGEHQPDRRVLLGAVGKGKDGKASEWVLSMPSLHLSSYDALKPGLEDQLAAAPSKVAEWVPAGTRAVIDSGAIPVPGDRRFADVKTGYPAPNDQVTCWREGNATFRFDARTRTLEAVQDKPEPEMRGFSETRREYIFEKGLSVDQANARTALDFHKHFEKTLVEWITDAYIVEIKK
jgi:hypothetical protein